MEPKAPKSKKKLKVVFIGAMILFYIAFGYLDFFGDPKNIYALVGKFVFFLLAYITLVIYQNIIKAKKIGELIFLTIVVLAFFGLKGHDDFKKYKNSLCLDKFGKEFNQRRRNLGIPVIPVDWHMGYIGNSSTDWKKKGTTGHYWKMIGVDSLCALEYEYDEYNLKPARVGSRSIEISTRFAKGKGGDTISYSYDEAHQSRTITRQQADSIFAVEKIQKDY